MAVAALSPGRSELAEYARDARLARFAALALDTIFFSVFSSIAGAVYGVTEVTWGSAMPASGTGFAYYGTQTTLPWIALTLIWLVYFTIPEAMFGATLGKALLRLRVVAVSGETLSVRAVVIRNLLRIIDALPFLYLIGGFSVLVTPKSQRVGDRPAGTTVVYLHHALAPGATRKSTPAARLVLAVCIAAIVVFSALFDYFGRPPLALQGLYNEHRLMDPSVTSYSLGTPTWYSGRVVYPISAQESGKSCTGHVELHWEGIMGGWQLSGGQWDCFPT